MKAIFFDMDGVITDTESLHFKSWQKAFKEVGYILDKPTYLKYLQSTNRVIGINNVLKNPDTKTLETVSDYKTKYYNELIHGDIMVFKDTLDVIKKAHLKGIKLVVVSSSFMAENIIDRVGLTHYFEFVVSGTKGLGLENKPEPDIYLYAMDKLGVSPSESLVIEDSLSGCIAGLKTNAKVFGIERDPINIEPHKNLTLMKTLDIQKFPFLK